MEKYSVLMPVYYKEKPENLRASIDSMLKQTVPPDQFVLVKDGPLSQELDAVINKYLKSNEGLFFIVELAENNGLGIALDEGLNYCKNDLVARMDSDDISMPDRCEKELKVFEQRPRLSIVSGNIGEFEDDSKNVTSVRVVPENQKEIMNRMRTRSAFNHPAVMYRKRDVVRCGGYGTLKRKQDHVLFSHMLHNGCQAYNIQQIILLFRADNDSVERKKSWDNCKSYLDAQKILLKRKECSLLDFLYVYFAQLAVFVLPKGTVKYLLEKFFRSHC